MAKKPETNFKEFIYPKLLMLGFFEKIQQKAVRGTLDLLGCIGGHYVGIELKTDDGKLDPLQRYKIQKIRSAGGIAIVMSPSNWESHYQYLKTLRQ